MKGKKKVIIGIIAAVVVVGIVVAVVLGMRKTMSSHMCRLLPIWKEDI